MRAFRRIRAIARLNRRRVLNRRRELNRRRVLNRKRAHKAWQLTAIDAIRELPLAVHISVRACAPRCYSKPHDRSHSGHVKAIRFDIGAHRVCIGQCRRSHQQRRARSRGTSSSDIEVAKILVHLVAAPRRRRRRDEKEDEDNKNTSKRRRSKHRVLKIIESVAEASLAR